MRTIVTPLHAYYRPDHLEHVVDQMRVLGPPKLRGYRDPETGVWFMQEGTHRLRAAKILGLAPVLIPVPWRRSRQALVNARHAAKRNGHVFDM